MGGLPKYLCEALGREKLMDVLDKPGSGAPGVAKHVAQTLYKKRKKGKIPPVEIYPVDEAIERAGL
jgi:hypothetical protein